jgi:ribosomal protein S18 acetylase RimI-like enzyme
MSASLHTSQLAIVNAESAKQIEQVRELFLEYESSLGFSLCFQGFDKELAALPGDYAPPEGRLLLAEVDGKAAGCGALHRLDADTCEMKRLYVRPQFRGQRLGRILTERLIGEARSMGYKAMRLDTVADKMREAVKLYGRLGFREVAPYRENPIPSALYMELTLKE